MCCSCVAVCVADEEDVALKVSFLSKKPYGLSKSPTVSQKSPVVNQKRPVLDALAFTAPSVFTPYAACGSAGVLLFCHGLCACVRACVNRGSGGRSQWADVKSHALLVRSVFRLFFLAIRIQLSDVVRHLPPHARTHTYTHTHTKVANQQQARLAYLGSGDTSVHAQDTMEEAASAGSVVDGGEEEREKKTEEKRGGVLVSSSDGANAGVAVAVPTHDAALCFRVV